MTETEWLTCMEPEKILRFLHWKSRGWKAILARRLGFSTFPLSNRKLRLFTAACGRHVWLVQPTMWNKKAMVGAVMYAEGESGLTKEEATGCVPDGN